MSDKISRRDFLKLTGLGTAVATVLTGCGPTSRYVTRKPYSEMPEYTLPGRSTFFATTCRECAAGCGLIVRTVEGRAIKVDGNPNHPVNLGRTCARGQAALQGLYNPDRLLGPGKQASRGSGKFDKIDWAAAVGAVKDALTNNPPGEIAFLMGLAPDHLYDLVSELTSALGVRKPLRFGALGMLEARATLVEAISRLFGNSSLPYFDIEQAEVVFSFGANFLETWVSPVAYGRMYGKMRQGRLGQRGYLVQFEPRMSLTGANADEWIPITPGTEGLVALALGKLVADLAGLLPGFYPNVDVAAAAQASGVSEADLRRLAHIFFTAARKVAVPGGSALGQTNGLEAALATLALDAVGSSVGQPGGVYLTPASPLGEAQINSSYSEIGDLVHNIGEGKVKALFVHGINPVFELPKALGFVEALKNVPLVISFASFPDEMVPYADYVLPDHTPLESWGYQNIQSGSTQVALSSAQPVVVPLHDTKATADVLLAAVQAIGGSLAAALPAADEVAYLQQKVSGLNDQGGFYSAPSQKNFWASWLQYGGWWKTENELVAPKAVDAQPIAPTLPDYSGDGEYHLFIYPSPILGDGAGANRPWLQETPDPTTTGMWGSWIEINPATAAKLGVKDDDVVKITSSAGAIECSVYLFPAIHPQVVAIPFGQGHTALGQYAQGRGANPLDVIAPKLNAAGDLAFEAMKVKITPTGKSKKVSRFENRVGVYGEK